MSTQDYPKGNPQWFVTTLAVRARVVDKYGILAFYVPRGCAVNHPKAVRRNPMRGKR